eukprot:4533254-Amphidinium_carterae.2
MARPGCRQSVFRAELLAVVRALEECQPSRVVSDRKGVVKALQAIQSGRRLPKGQHRDLEERARRALPQACQLQWLKPHQTRDAVDEGRITLEDFQGNLEADEVANLGAVAHAAHEPTAEYLQWETVAKAVCNFWLLVGPKLRARPEAWPRVRLLAPAEEEVEVPPPAGLGEHLQQAPKDLTDVWSLTTPLPDALIAIGKLAKLKGSLTSRI